MAAPKRVYMKPRNKYVLADKHIECICEKPGKISGTSFGAILGEHAYKSEFSAAVDLFGLADEDMTTNKSVRAGHLLEEPLIRYANEIYGSSIGQFIPASKIFPPNEGAHNDWIPHFDHPYFTGHIDGAIVNDDGEQFVLEVKTTKNTKDWFVPLYDEYGQPMMNEDGTPRWRRDGVPDHYYWQVALYNEFVPDMQKDHAYFVVGFLEEEELDHLEDWKPSVYDTPEHPKNVAILKVRIDRAEVQQKIAEAEDWYKTYILNGITPDYDYYDNKDYALWHHLMVNVAPEGQMQSMVDRYYTLKEYLDPLVRDMEQMKEDIQKWMNDHLKGEMTSEYGLNVALTVHERKSFDKAAVAEAYGIDNIDDYYKVTVYKSMTVTDPAAPKKVKKGKKSSKKESE